MTAVRRSGLVLAFALLTATASAQGPDVLMISPAAGKPVFGRVAISVEVVSAKPVSEVRFEVDGREAGRLTAPPWRLAVDVGQANVAHRFTVIARDVDGVEGRAVRETSAIAVDEEMNLELEQLYVTVGDSQGRVLDLTAGDFSVLDDGLPQTLVTFERGDVPLTAALLVDASSSMRGERLKLAVEGAKRFVAEMRPLDEATLLLFSDRLLNATPFTDDPAVFEAALAAVTASGGTAINDHLYLALKRLEDHQGRRVVILLTDGIDVESTLSMRDVLWAAGRSQAILYWIRVRDATALGHLSSWRDTEGHRQEIDLLTQAITDSGGRIVEIDHLEDADKAFAGILAELREQYVLGYYPTNLRNDGSWHRVRVRLRRAGLSVRARGGYVDF